MSVTHILNESAVGYAIFKVVMEPDVIATTVKENKAAFEDFGQFGKMIKLVNFTPFDSAQQALENTNSISEGIVSDLLNVCLSEVVPKPGKKSKVKLGVWEKTLAGSISSTLSIPCETAETSKAVNELLRGCRTHVFKLLKQTGNMKTNDIESAQLGLAHSYSRSKVKFSVNRNDNHIIQAIALLDHLDKAVNTWSMRCREWYSWHFPELVKIVSDNATYAALVVFIGDKSRLSEDSLHDLAALVNDDEGIASAIIEASKNSFGQDISKEDLQSVTSFAQRTVDFHKLRKKTAAYLVKKMDMVAPNLAALIGETVGARLISHAGSLINLSKLPASTVQILGAEKALFRALKTKGNTPKYGLIYNSSFIGRAGTRNKGRISRYLANKCSIASRCDSFRVEDPDQDKNPARFGNILRKQVEDRLEFYASGAVPMKNSEAMAMAIAGGDDDAGDLEEMWSGKPAVKDVQMKDVANGDDDDSTSSSDDGDDDSEAERRRLKVEKKKRKEEKKARKAAKELKKQLKKKSKSG